MSESSRKTPSPLLCLAFAMLIAYAGCSSTAPTVTTTPESTTTTATVSSSPSASSSPATTSNSTSPQTTNLTSPASASTPTTGSTATQATSPTSSPTSSPVTVTTAQSSSTLPSTGTPAVHDSTSTTMTTGQSTSSLSSSSVTTAGGVTNPSGQTATSTSQSSHPPDSTLTPENTTTSNITEAPTTAAPATPEPTTTPPTTPAPTTPAPTTVTTPPYSLPVNKDASFLLTIDVGPDKNVSCNGCNSSYAAEAFKDAFQSISGFLYIDKVDISSPSFSVNIRFLGSQFQKLNITEREQSIWDALVNINNTEGLFVIDSARKIANAFAEKSVYLCNMEGACNLGFHCMYESCVHMCVGHSCGDHGTCSLTISSDGEASPTCICNSDDETTYSGEYCQDSKISQRKVAAIVGGVLGAFCGLFIIIIIIMCCRQRESSSTKYQLGGTANQGYSSMGMKEL